eukprot:541684-Prorocentrum_minimum.AAC.2
MVGEGGSGTHLGGGYRTGRRARGGSPRRGGRRSAPTRSPPAAPPDVRTVTRSVQSHGHQRNVEFIGPFVVAGIDRSSQSRSRRRPRSQSWALSHCRHVRRRGSARPANPKKSKENSGGKSSLAEFGGTRGTPTTLKGLSAPLR